MNNLIAVLSVILFLFVILNPESFADEFSKERIEQLEILQGQALSIENGCMHCHSPKIESEDDFIPDPERLFSGHPGNEKLPDIPEGLIGEGKWFGLYTTGFTAWGGPWGITYAANITPDKETGIGNWTEKNFISVLSLGIHSSLTRKIMPPMPWDEISLLSDRQLKAIFKYLQTVKPVKNKVPEAAPFKIDDNIVSK